MYKRWMFLVLLPLFVPAVARAQTPFELLPRSRVAITPLLGYRIPFTRSGVCSGMIRNGPVELDVEETVEEKRDGGAAVGGEVELRVVGPLSLVGSVAYSRPPSARSSVDGGQEPEFEPLLCPGQRPQIWLAKAGLLFRLPDPAPDRRRYRPAGFLVAAPAVVRESFREEALTADGGAGSVDHYALNLGALVVWPLGSRHFALSFGIEDYITFWNSQALEDRFVGIAAREPGQSAAVDFAFDQSHILLLRAGASLRF